MPQPIKPGEQEIIDRLDDILVELKHIHWCMVNKENYSPEVLDRIEHPHGKDYNGET